MPCGFNWSNSNTKLMNIPAAFLYLMKDKLGRSSALIILVHGRLHVSFHNTCLLTYLFHPSTHVELSFMVRRKTLQL